MLNKKYPKVPILGLTATATVKVKDDIVVQLGIADDVLFFQSSYNRSNLSYEVRSKTTMQNTSKDIADLLRTRLKDKSGIIYCKTIKDCE